MLLPMATFNVVLWLPTVTLVINVIIWLLTDAYHERRKLQIRLDIWTLYKLSRFRKYAHKGCHRQLQDTHMNWDILMDHHNPLGDDGDDDLSNTEGVVYTYLPLNAGGCFGKRLENYHFHQSFTLFSGCKGSSQLAKTMSCICAVSLANISVHVNMIVVETNRYTHIKIPS